MTRSRPKVVEDALLLVADWRWRKGPRWKAVLAWLFGEREVFVTHLGHVACLAWWRGEPYLLVLEDQGEPE